jgi:hypothetical protein
MPTAGLFTYYRMSRDTTEPTLESEGVLMMQLVVEYTAIGLPPTTPDINNPDDIAALRTAGILPLVGSLFPGASSATWENAARFRGYTAEYMDGGKALRLGLKWTTRYCMDPTLPIANPYVSSLQLPVSTEYVARTRTINLYRASWTTAPPAASDATGADIGGSSIKQQDQGSTQQVPQIAVRMRIMRDATLASVQAQAATVSTWIGLRNSATFLGFAANTLIVEGVSVVETQDEFYEVVFEMLYDAYYHHEQVPIVDSDGKPKRTSAGELSDVRWKRLPRSSADFNNIFAGDTRLKARAEKGYW